MTQLSLLAPAPVRTVDSIDLRCCSVDDVLAEVRGARLIVADPPWIYEQRGVRLGNMDEPSQAGAVLYPTLTMPEIVQHLALTEACAAAEARLAVWATFPKLAEFMAYPAPIGWRYLSGGAWGKVAGSSGSSGIGFHWRGRAEIVLLYGKGSPPTDRKIHVANHHVSPTTGHSEKPLDWLRAWVRAWTEPGDLVLDLYAGLAPMARACALEGRRYVGAEIDPERHRLAMLRLRGAL